jgi:hypothetical protein
LEQNFRAKYIIFAVWSPLPVPEPILPYVLSNETHT